MKKTKAIFKYLLALIFLRIFTWIDKSEEGETYLDVKLQKIEDSLTKCFQHETIDTEDN